jgi:hypothetical protein
MKEEQIINGELAIMKEIYTPMEKSFIEAIIKLVESEAAQDE